MGIFQQFPYSNFHEMNLDQIIKIMREMQDEWEATKAEWASYKDFIDNYFANLDVSAEVLQALRAMAASGELNTVVDPTIIAAVTAWLADHITQPTTPAIDTSLTIAGAAADAKATGDAIKAVSDNISITKPFYNIVAADIEQGLWNSSGNKINNSTRVRTVNKIRIKRGATINFTPVGTIQEYSYVVFNNAGTAVHATGWLTSDSIIRMVSDTGYVAITFKKSDSYNITPADYDANTVVALYNEYKVTIELENGSLSSTDPNRFRLGYHDSHRRNKYPLNFNNNNAVMLPTGTGAIIFCNAAGAALESHSLSASGPAFFDIPATCQYMDIDLTATLASVDVTIFGLNEPYFSKRIYINNSDTIRNEVNIKDTLYTDIAYKLPPNYSNTGNKSPLIIWIAGNNGYPQITSGFPTSAQAGLEYLRDEGYAILQVFSWGSAYAISYPGCGKDQPYNVPIAHTCYEKGIKYFIDRYNIDPENIHIIGRSFGGQASLYYALKPFAGLKSVTMFDPVIDFLSMRGRFSDARKALAEELSLTGNLTDFYDINEDGTTSTGVDNYYFSPRCQPIWIANMPALNRLNIAWLNLTEDTLAQHYTDSIYDANEWWFNGQTAATGIYTDNDDHVVSKIPVKMMFALDDTSTPTQAMDEKIDQLLNAGNPTEKYTVPTGGHEAISVSTTYAQTVTTSLGITHEDVPIGWIEACKWIRKNS